MDKDTGIIGNEPQPAPGDPSPANPNPAPAPDPAPNPAPTPDPEPVPAPEPWYSKLPQEMHDKLKDLSAEDAAKVFERGSTFKPAASIDEIQLESVEGMPINDDTVTRFKSFAVAEGIPASVAAKVFSHYKAEDIRLTNEAISENKAALRNVWKTDQEFNENVGLAKKAIAFYDGKLGGVNDAVKAGLHSNASFIRIMAHLGKAISEADLSGGGNGTGDKAMSPVDFYKQYHNDNQG